MSLSSTLSSALSGLTAAARSADVTSSNIANAMTERYGVRRLDLSARVLGNAGSGVTIGGVTRNEDPVLLAQRRGAEAELGARSTRSDFLTRLEALIGTPDQPGSLTASLAEFEARLIMAANSPSNTTHLTGAVDAASAVASRINAISSGIQSERLTADKAIGRAVETINTALRGIAALNIQIRSAQGSGGQVAALMDAQAALIDEIAPMIPLQARRDAQGALHLYSSDGQTLVDHRAAQIGFTSVPVMEADMTRTSGDLSGLTLNGRTLHLAPPNAALGGGQLGALFDLRDRWGTNAQAQIDGVARDLASRFDAPGLDPSLAPGAPGLFTDAGGPVEATAETGLAGRLRINAAVSPNAGGAVFRLRDGLGAPTEGPTGNAAFLTAQIDALAAQRATVSGGFSTTTRSMSALLSDHLSLTGLARTTAETDTSHASARHSALRAEELARGVDTDQEMQHLLLIEQAFAANARVLTAVEQMMDDLLRIGR